MSQAALAAPDEATFLAGMRNITAPLDQVVLTVYWVESGIYGMYFQGTEVRLARFHGDGQLHRARPARPGWTAS